jgi:hypothetical protein
MCLNGEPDRRERAVAAAVSKLPAFRLLNFLSGRRVYVQVIGLVRAVKSEGQQESDDQDRNSPPGLHGYFCSLSSMPI